VEAATDVEVGRREGDSVVIGHIATSSR
jgi:hypothetical protein